MSKGRRRQQQPIPSGRETGAAEEATNPMETAWDSVNAISDEVRQVLAQPGELQPLLTNRELSALIPDQRELSEHRLIIGRDLVEYARQWKALNDQHKTRSGRATNADDSFHAIELHQQYAQLIDSFQTLVLPSVQRIGILYNEALALQKSSAAPNTTETGSP